MGRTHLALLLSGMTMLAMPASASAVPTVTIGNNPVVAEGNALVYNVSLSAVPTGRVTVWIETNVAFSYATAGSDYLAKSQKLVFAAGQSSRPFTVTTINDATDDRDTGFNGEYVWAHVTAVNGLDLAPDFVSNSSLADLWGLGVITDDDGAPTLAMSDNPVAPEGDPLNFTVSLSHPSDFAITAKVKIDPAFSPVGDYVAADETLTFSPGSTSRTFSVQTVEDEVFEPDSNLGAGELIWAHVYEYGDNDPDAVRVTATDFISNANLTDLWSMGFIGNDDALPTP